MCWKVLGRWAEFWRRRHLIPSWVLCCRGSQRDSTGRPWKLEMQSFPLEARATPIELLINSALSPSVNLETARQERSMLLSGDKRLVSEGSDVDLLCNQNGNYESLKLILIRFKCMCILPGPPKQCTWNLMFWSVQYQMPMQECSPASRWWYGDDVADLPPHNLMMWWAHHLRPDSTVWTLPRCSIWPC